jgi:DNA-binding MarR family transcriptional regulator
MKNEILDRVAEDLLSVPPLIGRIIRRKLLKKARIGFKKDITPPHFEIIKLLQETGTLHIAEIGERLQIARPQMTHLIDKLVGLGVVERQTVLEDRRIINVALTRKGRTTLEKHDSRIKNAVRETLSCFSDTELEDLSASLRNLRDMLSKLQ